MPRLRAILRSGYCERCEFVFFSRMKDCGCESLQEVLGTVLGNGSF